MLRTVLKEGKAIQATEDMHKFADEVVFRRIPKVGLSKFQKAKADKEGLTP